MKVRNKDRKFDIQKIYIDKNDNGSKVSFVVNNQYIELFLKCTYIDDILEKIEEYLKVISDDNIYYKI